MTDDRDEFEREELSPTEALASTKAAREALARRADIPWFWHAFLAAGTGVYLVLVAEPLSWWALVALVPWPIALVVMKRSRERRVGVEAGRATGRTADPLRWWIAGLGVAVLFAGMMLDARWQQARLLSGLVATALLLVGLRWINRRLVSRILDAA